MKKSCSLDDGCILVEVGKVIGMHLKMEQPPHCPRSGHDRNSVDPAGPMKVEPGQFFQECVTTAVFPTGQLVESWDGRKPEKRRHQEDAKPIAQKNAYGGEDSQIANGGNTRKDEGPKASHSGGGGNKYWRVGIGH